MIQIKETDFQQLYQSILECKELLTEIQVNRTTLDIQVRLEFMLKILSNRQKE